MPNKTIFTNSEEVEEVENGCCSHPWLHVQHGYAVRGYDTRAEAVADATDCNVVETQEWLRFLKSFASEGLAPRRKRIES